MRQNPHVRICGGPGSATTLVYPTGHEPRPRAPAASRPSHSRPGGRLPRPCSLATWQEGRVVHIVDDQSLIAIGVDRSVWLDARGEDGPGQLENGGVKIDHSAAA